MTADDLLAMPDDRSHRYELVKGELLTMSPAGFEHGLIGSRIQYSLSTYVTARGLGLVLNSSVGYVLSRNPDTVREPDVSFVAADRVVRTRKFFPGAPDLAVEVNSPDDSPRDIKAKVREYLAAGTRLVIVIDPDTETATMHTPTSTTHLTTDDTLSGGDVVPGWSLPLRELFS